MARTSMALDIARVFANDPDLAFNFYCAASEIVDDFDDFGPVLQANEHGEYDESTTIAKLRSTRDALSAKLASVSKSS